MRHLAAVLSGLVGLTIGYGAGFLVGGCKAERNAYHNRFREEQAAIDRILHGHPGFARIHVTEEYTGHASLTGELHWDDSARLYQELAKALGEKRAHELMGALKMQGKAPDFTPPTQGGAPRP